MKSCIIVCIGLPGAGKTTFCKKLLQNKLSKIHKLIYISYDQLSKGDYSAYRRKQIFLHVETLIYTLADNTIIIIDDNMYYKSMRNEYFNLARKNNISYLQIYFDVDIQTALHRNRNRTENKIPDHIIHDIASKMEKPDRHMWYVNANDHFSEATFNIFYDRLFESIKNPLRFEDTKTVESKPINKIHEIDLILRKIVSEKVKGHKDSALKYINKRKELLNDIKSNTLHIPEDNYELYEYLYKYFK